MAPIGALPEFVVGSPPQRAPGFLSRRVAEQEATSSEVQHLLSEELETDDASHFSEPSSDDQPRMAHSTNAYDEAIRSARISGGFADAGANQFEAIHDATSHPGGDDHQEQDNNTDGRTHARSATSEILSLYRRRPGDQVANSSVRRDQHPENGIFAGWHPLRAQPGPTGVSRQRDRLGHETDSSIPTLPHLRGPVDVSGYPYLEQAPGAPRLQPAHLYDDSVDYAATARLISDTGITDQENRYLRDDSRNRPQPQVHHGRSTDVLHHKDGNHQDSDDVSVSFPATTLRKQQHNELYLPTGYRKLPWSEEGIDATSKERGLSRKHVGDNSDDDLKQSSKKTPEGKGRGNDHISQNTTVSYIMKQVNDVPQQDPPQLQPALPVHPDMPKTKYRPSPINIDVAEELHKKSQGGRKYEIVHNVVKPKSHGLRFLRRQPKVETRQVKPEHPKVEQEPPRPTSSVYSQNTMDIQYSAKVSPLRINKAPDLPGKDNIIEKYQQWEQQNKESGGLPRSVTMPGVDEIRDVSPYTPLTGWLERDQDPRKGKKDMIGANGWLENAAIESQARLERKKGFFTSVKKRVQDMRRIQKEDTEAILRRSRSSRDAKGKPARNTAIVISFNPRAQAMVYCEIEWALSQTLDMFVKVQHNKGRLNLSKLKRIDDAWAALGRPRVLGYLYDLETQANLVLVHAESGEFEFYGPQRFDNVAIIACLRGFIADARQIQLRTYCYNDVVVAKHLLGARRLMTILGAMPQHFEVLASAGRLLQRSIGGDITGRAAGALYTGEPEDKPEAQTEPVAGESTAAPDTAAAHDHVDEKLETIAEQGSEPKLESEPEQPAAAPSTPAREQHLGEIEDIYGEPEQKRDEEKFGDDFVDEEEAPKPRFPARHVVSGGRAAAASHAEQPEGENSHLRQPMIPPYDQSQFSGEILQPRVYTQPKNGLSPWHPSNMPR
ncbi:hypothetical protein SLS62_002174 [Diatrype stigma]|uniref:Uncharacterized protein n=1 Tax=Diatrype stigma TaxID=117547 RepID=A0AAN9UZB0_9PEZI